eukprot:Ihof_evm2s714 gene=Ihof_evmTU2s714
MTELDNGRLVLIRIKRRLEDDPLEALILGVQERKRVRVGEGDDKKTEDLITANEDNNDNNSDNRVFRLLQTVPLSAVLNPSDVLSGIVNKEDKPMTAQKGTGEDVKGSEEKEVGWAQKGVGRYKIIAKRRNRVRNTWDTLKRAFDVLDIEKEDENLEPKQKQRKAMPVAKRPLRRRPISGDPYRDDAVVFNCIPMIREKLSLNDEKTLKKEDSGSETDEEEKEYVYDYYYQTEALVDTEKMIRIETFKEDLLLDEEYDTSSEDGA